MYATDPHQMPPDTAEPQPESPSRTDAQRRAEQKYTVFLESLASRQPTGDLLRERGVSSAELSRIRSAVRRGALIELSRGRGRPRKDARLKGVTAEVNRLNQELADMATQLDLLKLKESCQLIGPIKSSDVDAATRAKLVAAVESAGQAGMTVSRACDILRLSRQRFYNWRSASEDA